MKMWEQSNLGQFTQANHQTLNNGTPDNDWAMLDLIEVVKMRFNENIYYYCHQYTMVHEKPVNGQ
ncbi:hypothetical protein BLOT_009448 [Blomia tropicalis]|nr:hypothetical protein BLOT_009448 [Blomia tropicalis]